MSQEQSTRESDNPDFIQPPWQVQPEKKTPASQVLPSGWLTQVMSKTPVQHAKTATFNKNVQRVIYDGPSFYAFKEAYPNVDFGQFEGQPMDEDGKPVCHHLQQALNPWVQTENGKQHPQVLMRSTHPITENELEMLDE